MQIIWIHLNDFTVMSLELWLFAIWIILQWSLIFFISEAYFSNFWSHKYYHHSPRNPEMKWLGFSVSGELNWTDSRWWSFPGGSFKVSPAFLDISVISHVLPTKDLRLRDDASKAYRTTGRAFVRRDCIVWLEPPRSFQIPLATWRPSWMKRSVEPRRGIAWAKMGT